MKLILQKIILFFFLLSPIVSFADFITYRVNFKTDELKYSKIDNYDIVYLKNSTIFSKIGAPSLPKIAIKLLIPPGATATNVEIVSFEKIELPGKYNIYPAQPPQKISQQVQCDFVPQDKEIYSSNKPYPNNLSGSLHNGTKCGYRIVDFFVYPLRYIPAEKKLVFYTKLVLKIHYDEDTYPVRGVTGNQRDFWGREVESLVDNPDLILKWAPPTRGGEIGLFSLPAGNYEYVIIAPNNSAWIDSLDTLAYWKTKKGVPAKVVNLQTDIYDNSDYTGTNQWQIKQFITDAVNTWGTIWVLIAADHGTDATNSIPRAAVWADNTLGNNINDLNCERYYEDLDNDWDFTGDGIYGHHDDGPGGGELDWLSDVYVGRMMADNATHAGKHVRRILWFEKTPDIAFATRAIFASNQLADGAGCGSYGFGYSRTDDWKSNMPAAWTYPGNAIHPGYHVQQGINNWPGDAAFMGNSYYGAGYQFFATAGHGAVTGFNGDNCGYGQFVTSTEVDANYNPGMKCGISASMACQSGQFEQSDCVAEHLYNMGNVGGGWNSHYGVGYLSSDDPTYMHQLSDGIVWQFFVQIFSATNKYHLGEAIAEDKDHWVTQISDDCWNWCLKEWNTFGDPELPMWTAGAGPDHMLVTHAATVPMGASVFSVNVKDDDGITNLQNALVTCWCKYDNTMYVRQYTNASGNANLNVSPAMAVDTMWVTVTKQNYIPYEGYAVIAAGAPDAPTLIQPFDNARIGDGASSTTPTLSWNVPSDGEGDPLNFKVQWANDADFTLSVVTIESISDATGFSCSPPVPQGVGTCSYIVNSQSEGALTNGNTYWWRVAAHDGSNYGAWSEKRSFTVNTAQSKSDWFQTMDAQFETDSLTDINTSANMMVLLTIPASVETLKRDDGSYEAYDGTGYADNDFTVRVPAPAQPCTLMAAMVWVKNPSADNCTLWVMADSLKSANVHIPKKPASAWVETLFTPVDDNWTSINFTNTQKYYIGTPQEFHVVIFTESANTRITLDQTSDFDDANGDYYSKNNDPHSPWEWTYTYANSVFQLRAIVKYLATSSDSGKVFSTPIVYSDNPDSPTSWGKVKWTENDGDSIRIAVQYRSGGSWTNFADTGTVLSGTNGELDISPLGTTDTIRVIGLLYRKGGSSPTIYDWAVSWNFGVPNNPPVVSNISIGGSGWRTGDIVITYDLSDVESDPCDIDCEWWNGSIWQNATVTGPTSGITPGNGKTITWNSATDYTDESSGTIKFRIRAQGTDWGDYDESAVFDLDNKAPVISATGTSASWDCLSTSDIVLHGTDGGSGFAAGCPRYSWTSAPTNCSQGSGPYADGSNPSSIPSGNKTLYVYGIDDVGHETSNSYTNRQDCISPPDITDLNSTSHPVLSHWYSANNVVLVWTDVNDALSGTAGYRLVADNSATTDPTTGDDAVAQGVETYTYNGLADGNNWYFHIKAIDNADNLGANSDHYGPVWIDNTPPTNIGCSSPADGSMVGANPTLTALIASDALA
ncbi:hypothetical protein J7L68_03745, partial [bacterium]|nr:hypothetical protein [bacterium]